MNLWGVDALGFVFLVFIVTQCGYFLVNAFVLVFYSTQKTNLVPEEEPSRYRHVNVLLPLYQESRPIVEDTLANIYASDYPRDKLSVYLIHEENDPVVTEYLDEMHEDLHGRGISFQSIPVDRDSLLWDEPTAGWFKSGDDPTPRTKATALRYAFRTGAFLPDDVITVFDSDTHVPPDFFHLGVRGLEDYDIVQAKQTVRNRDAGWLPRLEAMGIATWSHVIYPRTTSGPYQLLGKGYFTTARHLHDIQDWEPASITEDMRLGLDAYAQGYTLGIIDRYVLDLCPANFETWVKQKTRWVAGPYWALRSVSLSRFDTLRFVFFAGMNQSVTLLNVGGVPAGIVLLVLTLMGAAPGFPLWLLVVVTGNLLWWLYYSVLSYAATMDALTFDSRLEMLWYFVVSNPFTQALYATVWAVPIAAFWYHVVRRENIEFTVTAKSE